MLPNIDRGWKRGFPRFLFFALLACLCGNLHDAVDALVWVARIDVFFSVVIEWKGHDWCF